MKKILLTLIIMFSYVFLIDASEDKILNLMPFAQPDEIGGYTAKEYPGIPGLIPFLIYITVKGDSGPKKFSFYPEDFTKFRKRLTKSIKSKKDFTAVNDIPDV